MPSFEVLQLSAPLAVDTLATNNKKIPERFGFQFQTYCTSTSKKYRIQTSSNIPIPICHPCVIPICQESQGIRSVLTAVACQRVSKATHVVLLSLRQKDQHTWQLLNPIGRTRVIWATCSNQLGSCTKSHPNQPRSFSWNVLLQVCRIETEFA